ncbi:MAG: DUF3784 domain-containing protein [Aequorivita sp.]
MIVTAIIFIVCGILIKYLKMYFLIAGYNTMSKEKRAKYDIERIANMMGNVFFVMAFIIILGIWATDWFDDPNIEIYTLFGTTAIGVTYILIKSNSSKYKIDK